MTVIWNVIADRIRAAVWRGRGVRMGRKARIGPRCRVFVPRGVSLGTRVWLEADVWLKLSSPNARVEIGDRVFFARNTHVNALDNITIGSNALFGPGCVIVDHNHGLHPDLPINGQPCAARPIQIGSDVWCGAGVVILAGVRIGDGAVIGANAVVARDIPPMAIAAGVPARVIRQRGGRT